MKLASTIKQLRKYVKSVDSRVFGISEYKNLPKKVNPSSLPALYVFTVSEDPKEAQISQNYYLQEITATVAVMVLVGASDNRAYDAIEKTEEIKEEIFKALLGFCPLDDPNRFYEYSNYRLLNITESAYSIVQLEFEVAYAIGYDDTFKPIALEKGDDTGIGQFNLLHADVDVIGEENQPDGQIDAKFQVKDLW